MAEAAKSWWARAILVGAVIAAVLLPLGALGTKFGIWGFQTGFLALGASTILAALGFVIGVISIFVSKKRGFDGDMPSLAIGIVVSGLIISLMAMQFYTASNVPPIHNISTNVDDPPEFVAIVALRGEGSNPLAYDGEKLGPMQQEAYPWVQTLSMPIPRAETVGRVETVLEGMGLEIVAVDPDAGIVEATDTTFWFGFKDDVVVRVRDSGAGSTVDVRSVSRVGLSDLGANARRIGRILEALQQS
jgi:uncharacterized protein (DUF1499 family)